MIFYCGSKKPLIVRDKKTNKKLCLFQNGKFETNDSILIEKLRLHFKCKKGKSENKGKTLEEIYGGEKAKEIKLKMSKNRFRL